MTVDPLAFWWLHDVTIERFAGAGATGPTYADAADSTGFVDDGAKLVTGMTGEEITSTARVYLPVTTPAVPLRSMVTLPSEFGGRRSEVISVARRVLDGSEDLPEHLELVLQ